MLNKKLLPAAVAATLLAGTSLAQAQEPAIVTGDELVEGFQISGNIALTTDYRFRGISQTDESAAVQGGFDAEFGPGFYIGAWGSSVDFGDGDETGSYGSLELDYYAGWASSIGDTDFGVDVGVIYYDYPGDTIDPEGDYVEVYVGGSWKDLSLTVYYTDDFYAETDEAIYVSGDYSFAFDALANVTFDLHLGYQSLDDEDGPFPEGGGLDGTDEILDYSVGVTYSVAGVDLSLAWVGTDLDEDDVGSTEELGDDTAVFTISKSL